MQLNSMPDSPKLKTRVLMLGEGLDRKGGIVSVEKLLLQRSSPDLSYRHLSTLPEGSIAKKLGVFSLAIAQLVWKLLNHQADLVHIHVSERGSAYRQMITAAIAQSFGVPVVMHSHSSDFREFYPTLPGWLQHALSTVFRRCSRFVVLSESWKSFYIEALRLNPTQVDVLPNAVNLPPTVPKRIHSENITFISLGRLGERKGSFDLIQAFAQLPVELRHRARLILAGDGETARARRLVASFAMEDRVEIYEWVNEEQRDELLANAHVFVLPSYREGLPMALLEAMSWGLAVVTTPVGGIPEVITHAQNGWLVEPGNVQQLASTMQQLLENESMRVNLGTAARGTVESFTVESYLVTLRTIYEVALGLRDRPACQLMMKA